MPNHIKNRIELQGSKRDLSVFVKKYSTHFPKSHQRAGDNQLIYKNKEGTIGWFNEETKEFSTREGKGMNKSKFPWWAPNVIPFIMLRQKGFYPLIENAWTRFPDFNNIIPQPNSLDVESGSMGEMGYAILTGNGKNQFMDMAEYYNRFHKLSFEERMKCIKLGEQFVKNEEEHGATTWYDWCVKHWGTKWNAYSCEQEIENVFTFETAWCGVSRLIQKMSKEHPNVTLHYEYSDEDTGSNCAAEIYLDGLLEQNQPENRSREAFELAFKLRPDSKEYYELVGDNYEYIEEE